MTQGQLVAAGRNKSGKNWRYDKRFQERNNYFFIDFQSKHVKMIQLEKVGPSFSSFDPF